MTIEANNFI